LISIFGQHLAAEEMPAAALPLPTQLNGVKVSLEGRALPLLYVSPFQINAQLPFDAAGVATLRVETPNGSSEASITISEAAPAIFTAFTASGQLPAVLHANGRLVSPSAPAEAGEFVSVYMTGLGQVLGNILAGQPAPSSPPLQTRLAVQVQLGGILITPSYAGLAPGFAGLYQVNLQVPFDTQDGNHSLRILAGGAVSNSVSMTVRSRVPEFRPSPF